MTIIIHGLWAVAHKLKVSYLTVLGLVKTGKLTGHRFGREWIVFDADLRKYMRSERAKMERKMRIYAGA
jgi:excisionase family DNA binding protein